MHRDRLPTRFCCKGPSGWDCRREALAVPAPAVLEGSPLAGWVPMSPELGSQAVPPVGLAARGAAGRDLARFKEPVELSFSLVDRVDREAVEVVLAAAVVAEEADYFARPSIAFASAFTTAMKIQRSMRGRIRLQEISFRRLAITTNDLEEI